MADKLGDDYRNSKDALRDTLDSLPGSVALWVMAGGLVVMFVVLAISGMF